MKPVPLIFELSSAGRQGYSLSQLDVPAVKPEEALPKSALREREPELPEVAEIDIVRHFTSLARENHGVDVGFYPLGSCTMKYNPKVCETVARMEGFAGIHPLQPEETVQGALRLMYELQRFLCEIGGVAAVSLQPAAGAHGELTGLRIIQAYHRSRGEERTKIIIPDSAHGTNPASAAMLGMKVVQVKSDFRGGVDVDELVRLVDDDTAGLMLTNPNTLGLFDENITRIADIVHAKGGLLYYDGANANAMLGIVRPGDSGFDVVHFNLHKTFGTPHGGGGPGSGPVGVSERLVRFLPVPTVAFDGNRYYLDYDRPESVGKVKSFYGNFGVLVKAYAYIRALGPDGLRAVSENAVLNANYVMRKLAGTYEVPYDRHCKHEFVVHPLSIRERTGVHTVDIAKRLIDYGMHPPTIYFPLIVEEALMVEPTETESIETLDHFVEAMMAIAREAETNPEIVKNAPHSAPVGRLDEVGAARRPILRYIRKDGE